MIRQVTWNLDVSVSVFYKNYFTKVLVLNNLLQV